MPHFGTVPALKSDHSTALAQQGKTLGVLCKGQQQRSSPYPHSAAAGCFGKDYSCVQEHCDLSLVEEM